MGRMRVLIAFAIIIASQSSASAWWQGGHMMVAYIAYGRLTPKVKREVDRLIAIPIGPKDWSAKSADFVTAAC